MSVFHLPLMLEHESVPGGWHVACGGDHDDRAAG
jgi:hypothetical protein